MHFKYGEIKELIENEIKKIILLECSSMWPEPERRNMLGELKCFESKNMKGLWKIVYQEVGGKIKNIMIILLASWAR